MKKHSLSAAAALLALLLLLPLLYIPTSAASYVAGTNDASDVYRESPFYEKLTAVPITGNGRTDVLAVALSQLGYQEGDENGQFDGTYAGSNNFTEYNYNMGDFGEGYGTNKYHWCACFVSFCLLQARCHTQNRISDWCRKHSGDSTYIWREVSCNQWATQLRTCGYFKDSVYFGGDYRPTSGDLIFFTANGKIESHIGLVLYSDETTVYTVEGNTSSASGLEENGGGVYQKSYELSSSYIRGYGVLPYETNSSTRRIDYSGENPTEGLYISTTDKYIYPSETATAYTRILPKYTVLNVTEVTDSGRVKAECVIDGEAVIGYVDNDEARIIQYTSAAPTGSYPSASELWGYKGGAISSYTINGETSDTLPDLSKLTTGDTVGISGRIGFLSTISSAGYFFDGDSDSVYWSPTALSAPDAEALMLGGGNAMRYTLTADTDKVPAGTHTVTFIVELSDGTLVTLASLDYSAKSPAGSPTAPTASEITETSVTLAPIEGYEYRVNGGGWQKSNVFAGLTPDTAYTFTQRIAETESTLASEVSTEITVTTRAPVETTTEAEETTAEPVETTTAQEETTEEPEESTSEAEVSVSSEPAGTDGLVQIPEMGCAATASLTPLFPLLLPALLLLRKREDL